MVFPGNDIFSAHFRMGECLAVGHHTTSDFMKSMSMSVVCGNDELVLLLPPRRHSLMSKDFRMSKVKVKKKHVPTIFIFAKSVPFFKANN